MHQKSQSTKFTLQKEVYKEFETLLLFFRKLFLLHFKKSENFLSLIFYINDFFEDFDNFKK